MKEQVFYLFEYAQLIIGPEKAFEGSVFFCADDRFSENLSVERAEQIGNALLAAAAEVREYQQKKKEAS